MGPSGGLGGPGKILSGGGPHGRDAGGAGLLSSTSSKVAANNDDIVPLFCWPTSCTAI